MEYPKKVCVTRLCNRFMIDVLSVFFLDYSALLKRYQLLLNNLVTADMDFTQLDAFLTSQVKKRQVSAPVDLLVCMILA